ncbi:MAG: lysylphosphatidylglycerol synthase domain-containing protein, partial [Alphaproteobacteria bacterium]
MNRIVAYVRTRRALFSALLVIALVGLGFLALHDLTREIGLRDVESAYHLIDQRQIAAALALTAASYLALTLYDVLALRTIGRRLPWRTAALASFTSYTISHNLGLGLITGGSARFRIYTRAGLSPGDVVRVVAIASGTFWLGVFAVTGTALLFGGASEATAMLGLPGGSGHMVGAAVTAAIAGLFLVRILGPRTIRLFGWTVPLPSPALLAGQLIVAAVDLATAAAALFVLVPSAAPAMMPAFFVAYALAMIAALITHVPGGLGIFEAVILATVPVDKAGLAAALIAYRLVYYILPLALGVLLLTLQEGRDRRLGRLLSQAQKMASGVAPMLMSVSSFLGGTLLLL